MGLVGIALEKAPVWRSWKGKGEEHAAYPHMEWGRQMAFVNHFWDHGAIPSPFAPRKPNMAAHALWDDLWVDSSASVRTAVIGSAPHRQFVIVGATSSSGSTAHYESRSRS